MIIYRVALIVALLGVSLHAMDSRVLTIEDCSAALTLQALRSPLHERQAPASSAFTVASLDQIHALSTIAAQPPKPAAAQAPQPSSAPKAIPLNYYADSDPKKAAVGKAKRLRRTICTRTLLDSNGDLLYECKVCGKDCNDRAALKDHMVAHRAKTFFCTEDQERCNRSFASKDRLRAHIKMVHLAEHGSLCIVCNTRFKSEAGLKKHAKTKHKQR